MLKITRRAGERIILGDDVIVEVLEIRGGTVRIGIDAPRALPVFREEIWLEVKRENEAAAAQAAAGKLPEVAVRLKTPGGPASSGPPSPEPPSEPTPPR